MKRKVKEIAKKRVITVDSDDSLSNICGVMVENHIKKAPVMSDGKMVGIINVSNITKYAFKMMEEESARAMCLYKSYAFLSYINAGGVDEACGACL